MTAELAHDIIDLERGAVAPILSKAPRAVLVSGPGKKFVSGDFSNIEGRVNAWFANEDWRLEAFRAYDARLGPDMYYSTYSKALGVPIEAVTKYQRDEIGKKLDLSCGFGGSVGAWLRFAGPEAVTKLVTEKFYGDEDWQRAEKQHDNTAFHQHLSREQWISIKYVSNAWRKSNPKITQMWWDLGDAVIAAVEQPGTLVPMCDERIQYLCDSGFLWCRLPSGKLLAYCSPWLEETKEDYLVDADGEIFPLDDFMPDEIDAKLAGGATI